MSVEYSQPRGKFERLTVECRKPQYQSPCSGFQKYECVFVDERWRMKKCRSTSGGGSGSGSTKPLVKKKWCKCSKAAMSKYRLSKLEPEERRMQRAFLKEHTDVDWRAYRPRFLKTVAAGSTSVTRIGAGGGRARREAAGASGAASVASAAVASEGSVLRDVAEDELEQVELIMENISDEISDLEVIH